VSEDNRLQEAFKRAKYPVVGHGPRNVQVLKAALDAVGGDTDSDMYGKGQVIEQFQSKMAAYLGKESAVFFPSGTMAQQIALRIWCDATGIQKVAYHPLCHLEIHEEKGLKRLHNIEALLLADKDRLITLEDVVQLDEDISCLLLELPQREIGGQLPDYGSLEDISRYCRGRGIKLHLDGARLFEVLPYYQKTAEQVCALFDSVYVSFYKGIGGIAGAILAGDDSFIQQSIPWKRRHGGDLISLYPYIISADYYFDRRIHKMQQYYEEAQQLAGLYNTCPGTWTLPKVPVSNMFHVHMNLRQEQAKSILLSLYEDTGIGLTGNLKATGETTCSFEVSIGDSYELVPELELVHAFGLLKKKLSAMGL